MELAGGCSIYCSLYKRSESLMSHCDISQRALVVETPARTSPPATLLEAQPPGLKNRPTHPIYGAPAPPFALLAPQFLGFSPLFKKFFAKPARPCPPCAESLRRALAPPENPGIMRQNRPSVPRCRPKIARKTPRQNPQKTAPHTPPRKKVE